ncbi:MAG: rhomboid family protein [Puniceicoccaceae bacterium]|nr:MAG: rhomboid family protein [Puniceicoccaceae bacterium]
MPPSFADARCFQHAERPAVARCPACERFYCRECVTEHGGRMICRNCLKDHLDAATSTGPSWRRAAGAWALAGLGWCWMVLIFYWLGQILIRIPSSFHNGVFLE